MNTTKITLFMAILISVNILAAEKWIYKMETITIPVGEQEHELYVYNAPDHLVDALDYGPEKFAVDDNENIYILVRGRLPIFVIKKFDKEGNYICSSRWIK